MEKSIIGGSNMADEKKPGAAVGAGVIEIIFSVIWIIVSIAGFFWALSQMALGEGVSVMSVEITGTSGFGLTGVLSLISALGGLALGVIGLIGAIMLLTDKKKGLGLSKAWAFGLMILFVLGTVTSILQVSAISSIGTSFGEVSVDVNMGAFQAGAVILGVFWALLWQVAPAIVVLILINLKPVKEFYGKLA